MNVQKIINQRIEFIPQIFGGIPPKKSKKIDLISQNSKEALQMASKYKNKILNWYKKRVKEGLLNVEKASVSMIRDGVIVIEYQILEKNKEEFFIEYVIDPDDDGNYPIKKNYILLPYKHSKKIRLTKVIKDNYINFESSQN
jgi:hypothetical protein